MSGLRRTVPVEVEPVRTGSIARSVTVSGVIEPIRIIGVNSQLSGVLLGIAVEEGENRGTVRHRLVGREGAFGVARAREGPPIEVDAQARPFYGEPLPAPAAWPPGGGQTPKRKRDPVKRPAGGEPVAGSLAGAGNVRSAAAVGHRDQPAFRLQRRGAHQRQARHGAKAEEEVPVEVAVERHLVVDQRQRRRALKHVVEAALPVPRHSLRIADLH